MAIVALILVGSLLILGIGLALWGKIGLKSDEDEAVREAPSCSTCSGSNSLCEQECLMEAATKEIEYFDDEHLDQFKGRNGAEYTDEEAEMFREVLLTMRREEAASWNRSLILRGIDIPYQVRDELIMMME